MLKIQFINLFMCKHLCDKCCLNNFKINQNLLKYFMSKWYHKNIKEVLES